jgi:hypothetical protein
MNTKHFLQHFNISTSDPEFFNIPVTSDVEAFICPFLIANTRERKISDRVFNQLRLFLTKLNREFVQKNERKNGLNFLSHLHEPNEYHLGYSETNSGKAISKPRSEVIFEALRNNRFTRQGMSYTNEAHNVLLLVNGIGQDIMSDFIANVCRNIFAEFTETVCAKYGIKTIAIEIDYFDTTTMEWEKRKQQLPTYQGKSLIIVPKFLVAGGRAYHIFYNRFIANNFIAHDLVNNKSIDDESKLVVKLKDGTKKAIISEILRVYAKPKQDLIDFVLDYRGSLEQFLAYAREHYPELDFTGLK